MSNTIKDESEMTQTIVIPDSQQGYETVQYTNKVESAIPPFRIYDLSNKNQITKEEVESGRAFMTVNDFLKRFEITLEYYKIDVKQNWPTYLEKAIEKGCDRNAAGLFAKMMKNRMSWNAMCTELIDAFDISLAIQKDRQKLIQIRQGLDEPIDRYLARYMYQSKKAEFMDGPLLVHLFISSLLDPIKVFVKKGLEFFREQHGYYKHGVFALVDDSLTNLHTIIQNNNDYFATHVADIFLDMKRAKEANNAFASSKRALSEEYQAPYGQKKPKTNACYFCGGTFKPGHLRLCPSIQRKNKTPFDSDPRQMHHSPLPKKLKMVSRDPSPQIPSGLSQRMDPEPVFAQEEAQRYNYQSKSQSRVYTSPFQRPERVSSEHSQRLDPTPSLSSRQEIVHTEKRTDPRLRIAERGLREESYQSQTRADPIPSTPSRQEGGLYSDRKRIDPRLREAEKIAHEDVSRRLRKRTSSPPTSHRPVVPENMSRDQNRPSNVIHKDKALAESYRHESQIRNIKSRSTERPSDDYIPREKEEDPMMLAFRDILNQVQEEYHLKRN